MMTAGTNEGGRGPFHSVSASEYRAKFVNDFSGELFFNVKHFYFGHSSMGVWWAQQR